MLKTKIIAADLQNLTDARYFAAWLVEYMSYDLSSPDMDLLKIKEIMDWVEGPINIAQCTGLEDVAKINEQLNALSLDHLIVGPFAKEEILSSDWQIIRTVLLDNETGPLQAERTYIFQSSKAFSGFTQEEKRKLRDACLASKVFLDCEFVAANIEEILSFGIEGLVLRGGEEEKVGVKSYEDLDEIFESLEE